MKTYYLFNLLSEYNIYPRRCLAFTYISTSRLSANFNHLYNWYRLVYIIQLAYSNAKIEENLRRQLYLQNKLSQLFKNQ